VVPNKFKIAKHKCSKFKTKKFSTWVTKYNPGEKKGKGEGDRPEFDGIFLGEWGKG
jgi:hypothetical protein